MSNIRVVNLSTYTAPKITEQKNKDFVSYGEDNNYYQYLIDQYQGSPTNNAIINGITEMIYGKGLSATNSDKKPMEYAEAVTLFTKDDLKKVCSDFYLLGQATLQVYYNVDRSKIVKVEHFPVQTLRAEKADKKGDVKGYYYFHDWSKYTNRDKLTRIPAFGSGNNAIEILCIKPYRAGYFYYTPVTYQGALPYCELEAEVANYHINNIQNGMAPSMLLNFNNGTPDEESRELIERRIYEKFSGSSNAGKFILAFNDNQESAATIDPVQLSDAHNQYQFLSDEATNKILVGHRLSSPLLLGIRTGNNGLGSNADELKQASILFDNMVIRVQQEYILDALDSILSFNNVSLNLYFKTLQPLEFTDLEGNLVDDETREEETGVDLEDKAELSADYDLNDDTANYFLDTLIGETMDDYELIASREYSDDNEDIDTWKQSVVNNDIELESIKSKPSSDSYLDKSIYKVRYAYSEKYSSDNTRGFCKTMMSRSDSGVVYRLEDIDKASREGVNKSFGHKGQPYDLFKYKGGPNCGHYWEERLYKLKKKKDGEYYEDKALSSSEEVATIPKTYKPRPAGHKKAKVAPKDMPNKGYKKARK